MDYILYLKQDIEDLKCELEELEESGDLEERLETLHKIAELEALYKQWTQ